MEELGELRRAASAYLAGLPELPEIRMYAAGEHPHVPAGSATGGQFAVKKGSASASKSTHAKPGHAHDSHDQGHPHAHVHNDDGDFHFDGKTGPGYGMPGGSKKVKSLQADLVRLGFGHAGDKNLSDGQYGPKTSAAVKKAQRALGMKADGIATPAFIAKLAATKHLTHRSTYSLPQLPPPVDDTLRVAMQGNAAQLHKYWTKGEGLAKWADSAHPWTSLYHHLVKYMDPEEAKRTAAEWFHDVMGFWPGSDVNRVTHGKPPRGHKVGPG